MFLILDGIRIILTPSATNTPITVDKILFKPNMHTPPKVPKSTELINAFGLTVIDKNVNIETNIAPRCSKATPIDITNIGNIETKM